MPRARSHLWETALWHNEWHTGGAQRASGSAEIETHGASSVLTISAKRRVKTLAKLQATAQPEVRKATTTASLDANLAAVPAPWAADAHELAGGHPHRSTVKDHVVTAPGKLMGDANSIMDELSGAAEVDSTAGTASALGNGSGTAAVQAVRSTENGVLGVVRHWRLPRMTLWR